MDDKGTNSKKTPADKATASTPLAASQSTVTSSSSQSTTTPPTQTDQPVSTPAQPAPPTSQPPIMNSVMPPKKKTGLIIGIITGSVVLLLAIAAVLLYFFWWQDPQRMVTDAVVNSFQTKRVVSSGKLVMNLGNGNRIDVKLKAVADSPKSKTEATITLAINGMEIQQDVILTMVADGKGTIYIKSEHLKDIVRQMVETIIKARSRGMLPDTRSTMVRDQILKQFDEKLNKIEGKWLKVSFDELGASRTNKDTCSQEIFDLINTDQQVRSELINAYRKNSFVTVKKDAKVEPRDGVPGFEIDLASDGKMSDRLRAFIDSLGDTKLGKKIKECYGDKVFNTANKTTSSKRLPTIRIWVDPWSHQLKALEIKARGSDGDKDRNLTIDMTFDYNKSEQIDIPSDADNLKSVLQDFAGSSPIPPPFARGGASTDENDEDADTSVER
ncbi:hypothetical protein GWK78_02855 [Candidatus Saccharibacteria bacterium oral taxon 488]|nr:hypothetical protein GWK78_02855 [Candidatus Saccharibacteria bacterium oral taxon 488]